MAAHFLSLSGGNLDQALNLFFTDPGLAEEEDDIVEMPGPGPSNGHPKPRQAPETVNLDEFASS